MAALSSFLLITASLFQLATAFWRLRCISPIVVERADPIISLAIPSIHVHTITGGNIFSSTTIYASTCSSCTFRGDFSTACIPQLSCRCPNGSFQAVPQPAGASIYFLQRLKHGLMPDEPVKGFPAGLSILAADPDKCDVSASNDSSGRAISWVCLDWKGSAKQEMEGFPMRDFLDGLGARVFFPSCCDGVTLDLGDHRVHMIYPGSHPVRAGSLSFEVGWGLGGMWHGETQPFVWAQGYPTGFEWHEDLLMGWDVDLLQREVETCTVEGVRVEDGAHFEMTSDALAGECVVVSQMEKRALGVLWALPGCNIVQGGPREAVSGLGCGNGAGKCSPVSVTKTVGEISGVVSSGVALASSSGSMAVLSSDPDSPTVLASSPNHEQILSSPTNSTHTEKPTACSSITSDHPSPPPRAQRPQSPSSSQKAIP